MLSKLSANSQSQLEFNISVVTYASEKMKTESGIILKMILSVRSVFHTDNVNQNNAQRGRRAPLIYSEHLVDGGDGILFSQT